MQVNSLADTLLGSLFIHTHSHTHTLLFVYWQWCPNAFYLFFLYINPHPLPFSLLFPSSLLQTFYNLLNILLSWDAAIQLKRYYLNKKQKNKKWIASHILYYVKPTVYEVTLDNDGVAHHVAEGQGTHFIHVSENNETILEEKVNIKNRPTYNCSILLFLSNRLTLIMIKL